MMGRSLATKVIVGTFIAYKPFYLPTVEDKHRKAIYMGRVTHVDFRNKTVQVHAYFTTVGKPMRESSRTPQYAKWRGADTLYDVPIADIYHAIELDEAVNGAVES